MFKSDRKTFLPSDQREKDLTYEDLKQLWEQEMNEMKDEENPEFIFQTMNMRLLLMGANKKINAVKAAKEELANRGYDNAGKWVGFGDPEKSSKAVEKRLAMFKSLRRR